MKGIRSIPVLKLKETSLKKEVCLENLLKKIQNKERNLLDESSKDILLSKANKNTCNWHVTDFCGYVTLSAMSFSFTVYNILNNRGKWQYLKKEKDFCREKK